MKRSRISKTDDESLREHLKRFEEALKGGEYLYLDVEELLDMLYYYLSHEKILLATQLLDYGLEIHPNDTDLLIEMAYIAIDRKRIQEAKNIAARITDRDNSDVILLQLELALCEGKLDYSEELLEHLNQIERQSLEVVLSIADIYSLMGYYDHALKWLKSVKNLYGEKTEYVAKCADVYGDSGDEEKAIELYNKVIDNDPYNSDAWLNIGRCYFRSERFDEAIEAFEFAIAADEECNDAYTMLATTFLQIDNLEKAEKYYRIVLERHALPDDAVHCFLGICYAGMEDYERGCKEFATALEAHKQAPSDTMVAITDEVKLNYSFCLGQTGMFDKATEIIEQLVKEHPDDVNASLAALRIYIDSCQEEKITPMLEKCRPMVMKSGATYEMLTLSQCYIDLDMYKEAIDIVTIIIDRSGMSPDMVPHVVNCTLYAENFYDFCRYNSMMEQPVSPEEAYKSYLQMCTNDAKFPMEYDEFSKRMEEAYAQLERNKKSEEKKEEE